MLRFLLTVTPSRRKIVISTYNKEEIMEDLIEHWSRMRYAIQAVEDATSLNISDRIKLMEVERIIFNDLFMKFALENMENTK